MKNNVRKNFLWNLVGSTINASLSLICMIIVTRINGIEDAGIFTFAFSTSCLLQVIGIYYGRAYQVTEHNNKIKNIDFIISKIITCLFMMLIGMFFLLIEKYNFHKNLLIIILLLYKLVEAFSESLYAIIQKNNDLYKVGISLLIKGILGMISFALIDIFTKNLILASLSIFIINVIVLLLYDFRKIKQYDNHHYRFKINNVLLILKGGLCTFLFTLLTQYIINAQKYAIDGVLKDELQAIFGIILMPATLFILCGQFLVHPFLVKVNWLIEKKDINSLKKLVLHLSLIIILIGGVCVFAAYLFGVPLLELVYGIKLKKYLNAFIIIIMGAILFAISYIISNVLIALRKTFIQVIIFLIVSIETLLLSKYLVYASGVFGAALAYFISMLLLLFLYIIFFLYIIKRGEKTNE